MKTYLTGDAYPVRAKLTELGCRYDPLKRAWYHDSPDIAKQAQALIDQAQPKPVAVPSRSKSKRGR